MRPSTDWYVASPPPKFSGNLERESYQKVGKEDVVVISSVVLQLVKLYQGRAKAHADRGLRKRFLPCEAQFGEFCSVIFARKAAAIGVQAAVTDLRVRCPKGQSHTNKALAFSALAALTAPLLLSINDPCFPGDPCASDPFSGKDPCSEDIAGCDC